MDQLPLLKHSKPSLAEGITTISPAERANRRNLLYWQQDGMCACGCGQRMTLVPDRMDTCTLDHITPNKMGCKKNDNWDNLRAVRFDCNSDKGSKRIRH